MDIWDGSFKCIEMGTSYIVYFFSVPKTKTKLNSTFSNLVLFKRLSVIIDHVRSNLIDL